MTNPQATPSTSDINAYAAEVLTVWRHQTNLSDADIALVCLVPDSEADAQFERDQVTERGYVFAPAKAVKARMLELIAEANTARSR